MGLGAANVATAKIPVSFDVTKLGAPFTVTGQPDPLPLLA
jgi:hypothetical protein